MQARDAADVVATLKDAGIDTWVDGGWGVDALVGKESRPHKDLDLIVVLADAEAVGRSLQDRGYSVVAGAPPASVLYRDDTGRGVDIRAVVFDPDGRGVYSAANGEEFVIPAEWLAGTGTISGVTVRCLTPEAQMEAHTGYEASDTDAHDVRLLRDSFDLPVPPGYE